ncbi:MAG: hypothetical protein ACFE7E_05820 [Candidatus Hodarchaeota archaeon]
MKLYRLYIIYRDGRSIVHKEFATSSLDETITSGFLSALNDFAKEALPSKEPLKVIEKGDIKVIFVNSPFIRMVLICEAKKDSEVEFAKGQMEYLLERIQKKYSKFLPDWDGNLRSFAGLKKLVENMFKELVRVAASPSYEELLKSVGKYYYSVDGTGRIIYDVFYRNSRGFTRFLNQRTIPPAKVDSLIQVLIDKKMKGKRLAKQFDLDLQDTIALLRNLRLRGVVSVWK